MPTSNSSQGTGAPVIASWPRRIVAIFVDWFVALLTVSAVTGTPVFGASAANPWYPLIAFFVEATVLTGLLGFSLGMRLVRIVVVGPDARPVGVLRAAIRTLLVCLVIPVLVVNADRRGLHDVAAGSIVTPIP